MKTQREIKKQFTEKSFSDFKNTVNHFQENSLDLKLMKYFFHSGIPINKNVVPPTISILEDWEKRLAEKYPQIPFHSDNFLHCCLCFEIFLAVDSMFLFFDEAKQNKLSPRSRKEAIQFYAQQKMDIDSAICTLKRISFMSYFVDDTTKDTVVDGLEKLSWMIERRMNLLTQKKVEVKEFTGGFELPASHKSSDFITARLVFSLKEILAIGLGITRKKALEMVFDLFPKNVFTARGDTLKKRFNRLDRNHSVRDKFQNQYQQICNAIPKKITSPALERFRKKLNSG